MRIIPIWEDMTRSTGVWDLFAGILRNLITNVSVLQLERHQCLHKYIKHFVSKISPIVIAISMCQLEVEKSPGVFHANVVILEIVQLSNLKYRSELSLYFRNFHAVMSYQHEFSFTSKYHPKIPHVSLFLRMCSKSNGFKKQTHGLAFVVICYHKVIRALPRALDFGFEQMALEQTIVFISRCTRCCFIQLPLHFSRNQRRSSFYGRSVLDA